MNIVNLDQDRARFYSPQIPDLIHATGAATYNYLFGADRVLFNEFMQVCWEEPENLFSHSETTVAIDGPDVLGIEIGYGGADWYRYGHGNRRVIERLFASGHLDENSIVGLGERSNYMSYMNPHIPDHAYYITSLSVTESARGTGLGAKLLTTAIDRARKEGYRELQLDVFSDNPAVNFYQAMGLTCMAETVAPVPCRKHGVPMEMRMMIPL